MLILLAFSFLAGIITVLSPCILPILPIILSGSIDKKISRLRPLGIVTGFVGSFTFFTLFLSSIVRFSGIPAETLRFLSVVIIFLFGLGLLVRSFQEFLEKLFAKLSKFTPNTKNKHGFWGGVVIGFSVGLLWTPCVGPILASVISLAITGTVTLDAFFITLAYATGTAIPMFGIIFAGQKALHKLPWLTNNLGFIQKAFGFVMILTALAIFFNIDRKFQNYILDTFPNYSVGLTSLEDNATVTKQLRKINDAHLDKNTIGKPIANLANGYLAIEIVAGRKWPHTNSLTIGVLKGKVVVIDFG